MFRTVFEAGREGRDVTPFGNRFIYLVTSQGNFQKKVVITHPSVSLWMATSQGYKVMKHFHKRMPLDFFPPFFSSFNGLIYKTLFAAESNQ